MLTKYEMPYIVPLPDLPDDGLRRWELCFNWVYKLWPGGNILIEASFIFNGASIPALFRSFYSPTGILFLASIVHDKCFRDTWFYFCDDFGNKLGRFYVDYDESNRIFKEIALISYPKEEQAIELACFALEHGGHETWRECRIKQERLISGR
jgi:hypothetical protein